MPGTTPASRLADLQKHQEMAYTAAASGQPGLAGPLGAQAYRTGFTMRALGEQVPESSWWAMKQAWPGEAGRMREWTPPAGRSGWGLWPEVDAGKDLSEDALESIAERAASESFGAEDEDEDAEPVGVGMSHLRGNEMPEVMASREAAWIFDRVSKDMAALSDDLEERGLAVASLWAAQEPGGLRVALAEDVLDGGADIEDFERVTDLLVELYVGAETGLVDGMPMTMSRVKSRMQVIRKRMPLLATWLKKIHGPVITRWVATLES